MSKNLENAAEILSWEPQPIIFDPYEQLAEDRRRLELEVEEGLLTPEEASEIYDLCRETYGIA